MLVLTSPGPLGGILLPNTMQMFGTMICLCVEASNEVSAVDRIGSGVYKSDLYKNFYNQESCVVEIELCVIATANFFWHAQCYQNGETSACSLSEILLIIE